MEIAEIRKLKAMEIEDHIAIEQSTLRRLRSSHALSPLDNPMRIRNARKVIARMQTVLRELGLKERKVDQVQVIKKEEVPSVETKEVAKEEK